MDDQQEERDPLSTSEELLRLRERWESTRNPIYVWEALSLVLLPRDMDLTAATIPTQIPDWCAAYLAQAAHFITQLTRRLPSRYLNAPKGAGEDGKPAFSPEQCVDGIPSVLGFTRKGWSAFTEYRETRNREYDSALLDAAKLMGGEAARLHEHIMKARNIDAVTSGRRATKGRRTRGKDMLELLAAIVAATSQRT